MHRRMFLQSLAGSLAGASLRQRHAVPGATLDRIGLELYAVRDAMRRNPERTLAAVRALGYADVELLWSFDNFGRTPRQVRASLDLEGLRAPSAHIAPETIRENWERSLETAKLLGHDYLIVPSLPSDTRGSLDRWRYWAEQFNAAGAVARKAGVWLAFHNEPGHMRPIGGTVPYDDFLDRTDPSVVRHQLDVGNMTLGGADPMQYLARHRDRYWSLHIKDVVADRTRDTELGKGTVNIRAILGAIPDLAHKPVYVEQESWTDSLASARENFRYLSQLEF
jgi:sugar phosphate isomerase/epimerase